MEAKLDRHLAYHLKEHSNPIVVYPSAHANPYRSSKPPTDASAGPGPYDLATIKFWQSVNSGVETIKVGDIVVSNPKIVDSLGSSLNESDSPAPVIQGACGFSTLPPTTGFVVAGGIKLFGSPKVKAHLHKWYGPAPSHVTLGDEPLKVESAHVDGDFHLSSVIESLQGTRFDKITFKNAKFYHQNYPFDNSKSVGWHFDGDLVVDDNCGGLYELLTKALGVTANTMKVMTLPVHAALGLVGDWKSPFDSHSFMLNGLFPNVPDSIAEPVPGLSLSTIGVRLMAIRKLNFSPHLESVLTYGFGVYGTMRLDVPDSVMPLVLQYEMRVSNGNVQIGATVPEDTWNMPFGVPGVVRPNNFDANANN
jgi:hypothetical protein